MTRYRRKALVIMGFKTPDRSLSRVEHGYNRELKRQGKPLLSSTFSSDFLVVRDKQNKRPGFLEVELAPYETPANGLIRFNPAAYSAIVQPWHKIDRFFYEENNNYWEVLVGIVGMHPNQRTVELHEQSDVLPLLIEWQTPHWLFRQNEDNLLNELTRTALSKPAVREFLIETQRCEAA